MTMHKTLSVLAMATMSVVGCMESAPGDLDDVRQPLPSSVAATSTVRASTR